MACTRTLFRTYVWSTNRTYFEVCDYKVLTMVSFLQVRALVYERGTHSPRNRWIIISMSFDSTRACAGSLQLPQLAVLTHLAPSLDLLAASLMLLPMRQLLLLLPKRLLPKGYCKRRGRRNDQRGKRGRRRLVAKIQRFAHDEREDYSVGLLRVILVGVSCSNPLHPILLSVLFYERCMFDASPFIYVLRTLDDVPTGISRLSGCVMTLNSPRRRVPECYFYSSQ